jgi:hypothetical protein
MPYLASHRGVEIRPERSSVGLKGDPSAVMEATARGQYREARPVARDRVRTAGGMCSKTSACPQTAAITDNVTPHPHTYACLLLSPYVVVIDQV